MQFIQILGVFVSIIILIRIINKYRKNKISLKSFLGWSAVWLGVGIVAVLPQPARLLAKLLGIGRAVDVLVYLSIILLFYLIFRIYLKLEELRVEITELVRTIALQKKKK